MAEKRKIKIKHPGNFGPDGKGDGIFAIPRKQDGGPTDPPSGQISIDLGLRNKWNSYVDYLDTIHMKGSPDLDHPEVAQKYYQQWAQQNKVNIPYEPFVKSVQDQIVDYRNKALQQIKAGQASFDGPNSEFMKGLSQVDGIAGQKTTSWKFPSTVVPVYNGAQQVSTKPNNTYAYADGGPYDSVNFIPDLTDYADVGAATNRWSTPDSSSDTDATPSPVNPITNKPFPAGATQTGIDTAILGLGVMKGIVDRRNENNINKTIKERMTSDAFMPVTPGNVSGNRGDYDVNSGAFRPDQLGAYSPAGMNNQSFADGGTYNSGLIPDQMNIHDIFSGGSMPTPPVANPFTSSDNSASSPFNQPKAQPVNDNAKTAYQYYVDKHGLDPQTAAAIVGNLMQESDMKPDAKQSGGNGRGIAQWDARDRWPAFLKWAKDSNRDPEDLHTQLDYVISEPGWGQKALQATGQAGNVQDATVAFGRSFERPSEKAAAWDRREGYATSLFQYPFEFGGEMTRDNQYKEGGEYDVSDEELKQIIANGGKVDFI